MQKHLDWIGNNIQKTASKSQKFREAGTERHPISALWAKIPQKIKSKIVSPLCRCHECRNAPHTQAVVFRQGRVSDSPKTF